MAEAAPVIAAGPKSVAPRSPAERQALSNLAAFFDRFVAVEEDWRQRNATYHRLIGSIHRFLIPRGSSVLEIGCGTGDLLASLEPLRGVGVDLSPVMVEEARGRHPELEFVRASGEDLSLPERFDYVVLSDLVPYAYDLLALLKNVRTVTHEDSRVVLHSYTGLWRPVLRLAELLDLKPRKPIRNWVSAADLQHLLELAGFEVVSRSSRILLPTHVPLLTPLLNGVVAHVWPFSRLCLTYWFVARPAPRTRRRQLSVSVIVPCRNEAGTIAEIIDRVPALGTATEIVFVEGGSQDGTREEIERQIGLRGSERTLRLYVQTGTGKGDAVRLGFAQARHDIVMVLDADLSVAPEALTDFYEALAGGRADLVNGSRFVYELEPGSMRALNVMGNKLFSFVFGFLLEQPVGDTLCGTKALMRSDWQAIGRQPPLGRSDPFGDFDLLLGAARFGLKIVDLPVRYHARKYGRSNISRLRDGWLLLRIAAAALRRMKVQPVPP